MAKMNWGRVGKEGKDAQAVKQGHPKKAKGRMTNKQEKKFRRKAALHDAKIAQQNKNSK